MTTLTRDQIIHEISALSKNSAEHDVEFAYRILDALKAHQQAAQDVELPPPDMEFDHHRDGCTYKAYSEAAVRAAIEAHQARQAVPQDSVTMPRELVRRLMQEAAYSGEDFRDKTVMAEASEVLAAPTPEASQPTQTHDLYTDADKDRPAVICDRNGSVTLSLCKRCGKGEAQLDGPCQPTQAEAPSFTNEQLDTLLSDWARAAGNHWQGDVLRTGGFVTKNDLRQLVRAAVSQHPAQQAEALDWDAIDKRLDAATANLGWNKAQQEIKALLREVAALATHPAPEQVERGLAAIKACQAMAADGWLSFGAEGMSEAQKAVLDVVDAAREAQATKGGEA